MKKFILKLLRPLVVQILGESLKVTRTKGGMVSSVEIVDPPKPPIDINPPIVP